MRELINAFSDQIDPELQCKLLYRLRQLTELERLLGIFGGPCKFTISPIYDLHALDATTTLKSGPKSKSRTAKVAFNSINHSCVDAFARDR